RRGGGGTGGTGARGARAGGGPGRALARLQPLGGVPGRVLLRRRRRRVRRPTRPGPRRDRRRPPALARPLRVGRRRRPAPGRARPGRRPRRPGLRARRPRHGGRRPRPALRRPLGLRPRPCRDAGPAAGAGHGAPPRARLTRGDPMDLIDLDRRALAVFRGHLAATPRSRLGDPTPCPDWDARALVDHVIGGNDLFAAAVRGDGPDWSRRHDGRVGDDPLAAWDPSAAAITAALAVADPDAPAELPFGTLTAGRAAAIHFVD